MNTWIYSYLGKPVENELNEDVSDLISIQRYLPDYRSNEYKIEVKVKYFF